MHHPRQHQLYESHSARTLGSCLILKAFGTRRAANPRAYPKTVDLHSLTSQFPPLKYEHFPPMESATLTSPFEKPIPFSCLQVVKFPTAGFSLRSTIRFLFYRINFPNSLIAFFGVKFSFILWMELRDSNSVVPTESSAFLSIYWPSSLPHSLHYVLNLKLLVCAFLSFSCYFVYAYACKMLTLITVKHVPFCAFFIFIFELVTCP